MISALLTVAALILFLMIVGKLALLLKGRLQPEIVLTEAVDIGNSSESVSPVQRRQRLRSLDVFRG